MAGSVEVEMVLAAARALRFVREEPPSSNRGQSVEAFQRATGNAPGSPWCASFVAHCGLAALSRRWPLPATGGCAALGEYAFKRGLLVAGPPQRGDIFLLYSQKLGRFAHTGFCTAREGDTIEGNASDPSKPDTREGWGVFEKKRTFGPKDRFIRWANAVE